MDINSKKAGLEVFMSILNMDKNESQMSLKETKDKIIKTNNDILETKKLISSLDEKIRELSNIDSDFTVETYELIRQNITTLIESEEKLISAERELSVKYNSELNDLYIKLKHIDVCNEKRLEYNAILQDLKEKRELQELDDICSQRKWVLDNNE